MAIKNTICLIISITCFTKGFSQLHEQSNALNNQALSFIENRGQWNDAVFFKAPLGTGSVYLENNGFTYVQMDADDIDVAHHHSGEEKENKKNDFPIDGHAWKTTFEGSNSKAIIQGEGIRKEYHNYFIGNNTAKWATKVPLYNEVTYQHLYPSIDLKVYSADRHFKYDFIIAPTGNPDQIKIKYEGLNQLEIRGGNLIAITSVGEFIENAPYAYQLIDGVDVPVTCLYTIENLTVGFVFPEGYNKSLPLIIDPVLVGATLSGGTVMNYGHCATYDSYGNIYTGASSFGLGYPTTMGAFQTSYGGSTEIAISKLSPDATTLLYATYLGGTRSDLPHSMVVNSSDELYVFGTTKSNDYPISIDAFDSIGPGPAIYDYTELVITHLTEDGAAIVGSTFMGGSHNDGLNTLTINYGDSYRGEIIVDLEGNCYVASCTRSTDFPVTPGAVQETYGGGLLDAVVFSLSPDLSTLNWSTYLGGSNKESALGLRLDQDNNIYVCGAAADEFMSMSGYQTSYQGGITDGYVLHITDDGTTLSASSYWGTSSRDAAFFIDLDSEGYVYLYGQSSGGTSEVTPGVYVNPGSQQFISKLSPDLNSLDFATVIGAGAADFIPIAFMVDGCNFIYFSGHTAIGDLPLTDDALFDEGNFYLGVLKPGALDLEFATLYSGGHVDGGTSRFDPLNGTVYQAVCACEPFTTTPGAFASELGGACDIGVFKIDFDVIPNPGSADVAPASEGCAPFTVSFNNYGAGVEFEWDFGDGTPLSTEFEPTHTYAETGIYTVQLITKFSDGCLLSDTVYIEIIVFEEAPPEASFEYDVNCATKEITITYTGTPDVPVVFTMGDGTTITETDFTHTYLSNGIYTITLTVGDGICADFSVETQEINIGAPAIDLIFNNPTCHLFSDGSFTIDVLEPSEDEVIIIIDEDENVLNIGGSNTANTLASGWYYYSVDLGNGCALTDSILLVDPPAINAQIVIKTPLCYGQETGHVIVDTVYNWQGSYDQIVYIWTPDPNGSSGQFADTLGNVGSGNYTLMINDENGCSKVFDVTITEPEPLLFTEFGYDPAYCRLFDYQSGNGVVFGAAVGGTPDYTYQWTNLETGESVINTTWGGLNPGTYELAVTDENGCTLTQSLVVDSLNPIADFTVTTDQLKTDCEALVPVDITFTNKSFNYTNPNDPLADTTFFWNFNHDNIPWQVSHDVNEEFIINYAQSGTYEVCLIAINKNGCTDTTCKTLILCDPTVFVPVNIFTPNDDAQNDVFTFVHKSIAIKEFYCVVINRWGVTIAEFYDITQGWDGTDKQGNLVPDGVYFYKYVGKEDTGAEFNGQGTVQVIKG